MNIQNTVFTGCATALITPFSNGKVDFEAMEKLIEFQIENGVDALVILGTTGESPTVRGKEREKVISFAKKQINSRVPMIIGTGSNSTHDAVKSAISAVKLGADALLCVTPYYNKASQNGLILHYKEIAKKSDVPIILYNVPSRTGVNVTREVLSALSECKNIVGIKEASGNMAHTVSLISEFYDRFDFYSGCDELIAPILSVGGKGVISAVSNVIPLKIRMLCKSFFENDIEECASLQRYINPLVKEMFAEVNPIPVKTALSLMGLCKDEFRLPMCQSSRRENIKNVLSEFGIIHTSL